MRFRRRKIENGFELVFRFEIQYQCMEERRRSEIDNQRNVSKRVGRLSDRGLFDDRLTLWMKSRSGFVSPRFFHNPFDCTARRVGGRGASLPPPVIPPPFCVALVKLFHALSFSRLSGIETGHGGISVRNAEIFLSRMYVNARNASISSDRERRNIKTGYVRQASPISFLVLFPLVEWLPLGLPRVPLFTRWTRHVGSDRLFQLGHTVKENRNIDYIVTRMKSCPG